MNKLTKTSKFLAVAVMLIGFCAVGAKAQTNYGNMINPEPLPREFQEVIDHATFSFWHDLGLFFQGKYEETQKEFRRKADKMAEEVNKNPENFFRINLDVQVPINAPNLQDQLQKSLTRMVAHKNRFLSRYNQLQDAIRANRWVFPGYVLVGEADLSSLSAQTMESLHNLFSGTNSTNTRDFAYQKGEKTITIFVDKTTKVLVLPEQRHLLVVSR